LLLSAAGASAQEVVSARAGTVHFTMGDVSVDEQPVRTTALNFPLLKDGQVNPYRPWTHRVVAGSGSIPPP
jgi:hypothetical protein